MIAAGILSGREINNGNGTFHVDTSGNVTANSLSSSNATITGGSVDIDGSNSTDNRIKLSYETQASQTTFGFDTTINPSRFTATQTVSSGGTDTVTEGRLGGGFFSSYTNGKIRTQLSAAGLSFYDSSGTLLTTILPKVVATW